MNKTAVRRKTLDIVKKSTDQDSKVRTFDNKYSALRLADSDQDESSGSEDDRESEVSKNVVDIVITGAKTNTSNVANDDDWTPSDFKSKKSAKKDEVTLYIETTDNSNTLGNNLFLNSPWTVWIHKSDCNIWTEDSYTNIYVINSIGSFWRFFNNFHRLDKVTNQLFIMRNKVKPIWEDNIFRHGGMLSVKLNTFSRQGRGDVDLMAMCSAAMCCISLLIMNETLIPNTMKEIHGISYTVKPSSVLIKIWCRDYSVDLEKLFPAMLRSKLETIFKSNDRYSTQRRFDNKFGGQRFPNTYERKNDPVSFRWTEIKPEGEVLETK